MVDAAFDAWGRETVTAAAACLVELLPDCAQAQLGGEGGPRTVGAGYRSAIVRLRTPRLGAAAIWLFAVPSGHEYSDTSHQPRLGAGILDPDLVPFKQGTLAPPMGGPVQYFRWHKTRGGWTSHLTFIGADPSRAPAEAGADLAQRAVDGLRRLRLLA